MEFFDYTTLRLIWWGLLGVLLIGFALTGGFDLGSAILLPVAGRTDSERRVVINTIGPVWEGNQVWFILGGAAIFAAWPALYALSFSGFYLAMFLVLCALILRPVGFKFRSKLENPRWRSFWDWALFIGGFVPALVFGVAFGNLLRGVNFQYDADLRLTLDISLFGLLNPFALLCGLVSVAMVTTHGAAWLAGKTDAAVARRARRYGTYAAVALIALYTLAGVWVTLGISGQQILSSIDGSAASNPLSKEVGVRAGAWIDNYAQRPWTLSAPMLGYLGALIAALALYRGHARIAFAGSSLMTVGVVATPGFAMFPFLMPSASHPTSGLTVWDASSSQLTLGVMLVATAFFLPIIVAYTAWVYRVMRGRVTIAHVEGNRHSTY